MTTLFLRLFNISVTAGWIVLAVAAVRLLFRRMPRWSTCLLWGIVGLRLLLPITLESPLSLLPSPELIPQNIASAENPAIYSGIPAVNKAINPLFVSQPLGERLSLELLLQWAAWIWLAGAVLILAYGMISYIKLCRQVRVSVRKEGNIYLCDQIQSPFLLGLLRPRIYIPSGLEEGMLGHILAHEQAHIRRRDHWWKPLGYLLLCIYWFNPLLWMGYILLCRDIERACDEKVIAKKDGQFRLTYMNALVSCSLHRRMILACPVAFGEVSVKTRVKGIARYQKPTVLVIAVSTAICALVCICFLTTPKACAHDYTAKTTLQATCTEHGVQTNTCRLCQHTYMQTTACLAHAYDAGTVTLEATCTHTGSRIRHCTGCGAAQTESIPQAAHTPGQLTVTVEPNCTQGGVIRSECTRCRVRFVAERTAPNGEHSIRHQVIKAATCTEPGLAEDKCVHCGMGEQVVLEPKGHDYKVTAGSAPGCAYEGYETRNCTECNHEIVRNIPRDPDAHSWESIPGYCRNCPARITTSTSNRYPNTPSTGSSSTTPSLPVIQWDLGAPSPMFDLPDPSPMPHPFYG